MSLLLANLHYQVPIDVYFDLMGAKIYYKTRSQNTQVFLNISQIPNIEHSFVDLGSLYLLLECIFLQSGVCVKNIFNNNERCCILKQCTKDIKYLLPRLATQPYNAMTQMSCSELDSYFLHLAQTCLGKTCHQKISVK